MHGSCPFLPPLVPSLLSSHQPPAGKGHDPLPAASQHWQPPLGLGEKKACRREKDRGLSSGMVEGLWKDCFQPPLGTSWILLLLAPGPGTVDAADIAQIQEADPYPAHIQKAAPVLPAPS